MSGFPERPQTVRGGLVLVDALSGRPVRTIPFQYNPDTLTRTLTPQGIKNEPGDRLEAMRLKGPPQESIKLDAEFDATDQLDRPEQNPREAADGLYPVLSALEMSIYPSSERLRDDNMMAAFGILEIAPAEAPLILLVLGKKRVLPVHITEFSVTEEAFDTSLNPIRAKVSLGMRVLTVNDVGFDHTGGQLYLKYHRKKEQFADLMADPTGAVGFTGL